ncbi:MAG: NAD-dependent protein deacylase [Treponema sp. CETP13]|nr:MAG: NAD-dependent protein deacylase [Treponema sp. CETP13]
MNGNKIEELQEIIDESSHIVFFGGAGVSTESGIPDFRSTGGLYRQQWNYPPEQIISHSFFENNPKDFFRFYTQKMIALDAKPNAAHLKLAELEKAGKLLSVVTQNIDGLHQKAGSKNVWELHGSVLRNYCQKCGASYTADEIIKMCGCGGSLTNQPGIHATCNIPYCNHKDVKDTSKICNGIIKPDVVLYEEGLNDHIVNGAVKDIARADTLIVGGTSLVVYPAAGLINYFHGKNIVLINKSETNADTRANLVIHDSIGKVLEQIKIN